jgi:benzodiazapine receptor
MNAMKKTGRILLFIGIGFLPAVGALAVRTDGWYASLNKPLWTPPATLFGPIWSVLYALIGLAGCAAWTRGNREERYAVFTVYGVQLTLNALWTPIFFGLQRPDWAFSLLILLWFAIVLCIGVFSQRSSLAAWLMIPYFLWVSFAGALNAAIMVIN